MNFSQRESRRILEHMLPTYEMVMSQKIYNILPMFPIVWKYFFLVNIILSSFWISRFQRKDFEDVYIASEIAYVIYIKDVTI